jgi:hypothetical protein
MDLSLNRDVISSAAELSERLISIGCSAEGLYLQGVVIEAARTESDVNGLLEEIVPRIPKLQETEESRDFVRIFRNLITSLVISKAPDAALKAMRVGTSLSLTARDIQPNWSELAQLNWPENMVIEETDLSHVYSMLGKSFLECGRPEGAALLREATRFRNDSTKYHALLKVGNLESIPFRDKPGLAYDIADKFSNMEKGLVLAERYRSAVALRILASGLSMRLRSESERVEGIIERLWGVKETGRIEIQDVMRMDADVCSHLMMKGYPAEATDFFRLALDVPMNASSAWMQIWNIVQSELPSLEPYPHKGTSTSKPYQRIGPIGPTIESTRVAESVLSRHMPELTDVVSNRLDAARSELDRLRVWERTKSESTTPRRQVNAWLEEAQQPLTVGRSYRLGVNIGSPRADSLVEVDFREPEWGALNEIGLVIAVHARGARIEPLWHNATLLRKGEMEEVYFNIVPIEEGVIELYLTIFLARELTLLEEFRFTLLSTSGVLDESSAN